ncbi:MAG: DNA polymerase III subunit gamma/tau [Candidatus Peregrinibacteria bacterium]
MSLYLKYRPQDFSTMVGQDHVVSTIQNALNRKAITHAYLFAGPRGTGKTSLARIIAKAINCLDLKDGQPCNRCEICENINKGRLVDLIEIDAASNRGIDEIRELREKIQFAPTHAKSKVYIIDEVHMLTKEAFNALLKTLEEPPEHAYFILATTEAHKIPETIISRCQQFTFKRIGAENIEKQLEMIAQKEGIKAESEALSLIAKMANGGLRDAIGMFEQMNIDSQVTYEQVASRLGFSGAMLTESFFQALVAHEANKALEIINQVNTQGKNLHQFVGEIIGFLREQMLINMDNAEKLPAIMEWLEIFSEAKQKINQSLIPQLPLEMAIVRICGIQETAEPDKKEKKAKAAAEKKEAAKEKQKEEKEEIPTPGELTFKAIKDNWKQVAEKIETPFIRVSFLDGEPIKFEKGELHLAFKSDSMMEKIQNQTNQAQVQKAFQAIFNNKIRLRMELKKVKLKPVESAPKTEEINVADMAREVFGG